MRWAVINQGQVINVIEADAPIAGLTMVPTDAADIGWSYDGSAFTPPPPPPPPPPPERWPLLKSTLINRLTDEELAALDALLTTLPLRQRELWHAIRWFWSDDPRIISATQALGWSTTRVAELLAFDDDPELALIVRL